MKFTDLEAVEIIKKNLTCPQWVQDARATHKELKALVYGEDYKELLLKIEHIEDSKLAKPRQDYARSIQGLNQRLLKNIDNVYTATGGTKEYSGVKDENDRKKLLKKLTNIRDNKSLEKWLQTYWAKDLYVVDPCGLIMLEYKGSDLNELKPTYKSINTIRNYYSQGQILEWLLFEPVTVTREQLMEEYNINVASKKVELYRFVDDENDYRFIRENDTFTIVPDLTFTHPFGKVPALTNSNKYRLGKQEKLSFIADIILDEKEYLRDQSVLTIYKYKNGFPVPYRPRVICSECKGLGKQGEKDCDKCDGKGFLTGKKDVSFEIVLPVSLDGEVSALPTNFAGYIVPPLDIWNQYRKDLTIQEDDMNYTLWGSRVEKLGNETATGRFIDQQPVENSLAEFSDVAQFMEFMFTEWIANFIFTDKRKDETVSNITYGKRFIIEQPDALLKKYYDSKGSTVIIRDRLLTEYLTSKYKNDITTLREELTKKQVEPYVHFEVKEIIDLFGAHEAMKKVLFTDFWEGLEDKSKTRNELIEAFEKFTDEILGESVDEGALAIKLGVGGTQSLQSILTDPVMSLESKRATIEILFGIPTADVLRMLPDPAQPAQQTQSTQQTQGTDGNGAEV